jgi:hypothetical protein
MKLEEQIRDLERQQQQELRNATFLIARTKRDVKRKLSPDRIVRKNIGVAMAVAALGAMLLAPAPRRERAASNSAPSRLKWLRAIKPFLPAQFQHFIGTNGSATPPSPEAPGAPALKRRKGLVELLAAELVTVAAQRVDWGKLIQQLMTRFGHGGGASAPEEPSVAVGDAGTTSADEAFDGSGLS